MEIETNGEGRSEVAVASELRDRLGPQLMYKAEPWLYKVEAIEVIKKTQKSVWYKRNDRVIRGWINKYQEHEDFFETIEEAEEHIIKITEERIKRMQDALITDMHELEREFEEQKIELRQKNDECVNEYKDALEKFVDGIAKLIDA